MSKQYHIQNMNEIYYRHMSNKSNSFNALDCDFLKCVVCGLLRRSIPIRDKIKSNTHI